MQHLDRSSVGAGRVRHRVPDHQWYRDQRQHEVRVLPRQPPMVHDLGGEQRSEQGADAEERVQVVEQRGMSGKCRDVRVQPRVQNTRTESERDRCDQQYREAGMQSDPERGDHVHGCAEIELPRVPSTRINHPLESRTGRTRPKT
jgi:hypothetical protein